MAGKRKRKFKRSANRTTREQPQQFQRPLSCSRELALLLSRGTSTELTLTRSEAVKQIWAYVKDLGLQDPTDGRRIVCNTEMKSVFGVPMIPMLALPGKLSRHLSPDNSSGIPITPIGGAVPSDPKFVASEKLSATILRESAIQAEANGWLVDGTVRLTEKESLRWLGRYAKSHSLVDERNKCLIRCDSTLRALFGADLDNFTVSQVRGLLKPHLLPTEVGGGPAPSSRRSEGAEVSRRRPVESSRPEESESEVPETEETEESGTDAREESGNSSEDGSSSDEDDSEDDEDDSEDDEGDDEAEPESRRPRPRIADSSASAEPSMAALLEQVRTVVGPDAPTPHLERVLREADGDIPRALDLYFSSVPPEPEPATAGAGAADATVLPSAASIETPAPAAVTVPERFLCPITLSLMTDPVIAADGHSYERSAIEKWLKTRSTSPKTNVRLRSKATLPNHTLRAIIMEFREAHPDAC